MTVSPSTQVPAASSPPVSVSLPVTRRRRPSRTLLRTATERRSLPWRPGVAGTGALWTSMSPFDPAAEVPGCGEPREGPFRWSASASVSSGVTDCCRRPCSCQTGRTRVERSPGVGDVGGRGDGQPAPGRRLEQRGAAARARRRRGVIAGPRRSRLATTDAPSTPAGPDQPGSDVSIEVSSTGASSTRTARVERSVPGRLPGPAEDEHLVERDVGTGRRVHGGGGLVAGPLGEDHRLRPPVDGRPVGDVDVGVPARAGAAGRVDDRRRHRAHRDGDAGPDVDPHPDVVLAHRRCPGADQPQRGAVPAEPHRRAAQHAVDAHRPARAASQADRHLGVGPAAGGRASMSASGRGRRRHLGPDPRRRSAPRPRAT